MRPIIALIFSSALGTALFGTRVLVSGSWKHLYLLGNLILAWIPWLASTFLERSLARSRATGTVTAPKPTSRDVFSLSSSGGEGRGQEALSSVHGDAQRSAIAHRGHKPTKCSPAPLNGETAGVRGETVPLASPFAIKVHAKEEARPWKTWAAFAIWFLFFPNSPYIFTDLVHLGPRYHGAYWIDMLLILLFALTGLVLGFISLRSMQRLVAGRFGWQISWLFVGGMSLLSGIGIYAGRFLRWNSWDVIARPWVIAADAIQWAFHPFAHPLSIAFPIVCGLFIFAGYLTIWSLAEEPRHPANT